MPDTLKCPDCGHTRWLGGPFGGLAQNIMCAHCGEWYNYMPVIASKLEKLYEKGFHRKSYEPRTELQVAQPAVEGTP